MVSKRHRELGERSGEAYANLTMRCLRSVLNFARATYEDGLGRPVLIENPVLILSQTRAWYRSKRRQTVIKRHQLPAWYAGVMALKQADELDSAHTVADYLLVLLFTGLRSQEAARLRWSAVDLEDKTFIVRDTKNRDPLTLPLSAFLYDLLDKRAATAEGGYVFPGKGNQGRLIEPKRQIRRVIEGSEVPFTLHDLRRTFITVAESLDIAPYAIKRLVNHKTHDDVTAGYIIASVERLRGPMQKITDYLLSNVMNETGNSPWH